MNTASFKGYCEEFLNSFNLISLDEEEYVVLRRDAPDWVVRIIEKAHDGIEPRKIILKLVYDISFSLVKALESIDEKTKPNLNIFDLNFLKKEVEKDILPKKLKSFIFFDLKLKKELKDNSKTFSSVKKIIDNIFYNLLEEMKTQQSIKKIRKKYIHDYYKQISNLRV